MSASDIVTMVKVRQIRTTDIHITQRTQSAANRDDYTLDNSLCGIKADDLVMPHNFIYTVNCQKCLLLLLNSGKELSS